MSEFNPLGPSAGLERLSRREIEILRLISDGLSNREISEKLHLSTDTVKWYNKQLFAKLGVTRRTQAVKAAGAHHLLDSSAPEAPEDNARRLSNLPAPLTSYVGRQQEIAEIKALLTASRLVVLAGPGGTGKTRLALQVAGELAGVFPDGVWLVELAPVSDPLLVADAIAQALRVDTSGSTPVVSALKRFLARRQLLLIMDNFEHLLAAVPVIGELLAAAPRLTVLATSRDRLRLYGEQEYPVHPLELPPAQVHKSPAQLLGYDAIALFIQRARAAQPGLVIDDPQISAIARICLRLDGLPLAIELAAAQVNVFPPVRLAQRLEASLSALASGARNLPARQQNLRATIAWSEDLLTAPEKVLFARLAVFRGGGTLEALQVVCGHGLSAIVADTVGALVGKNLVRSEEAPDGELRFTMLETIRDFAEERLGALGEAELLRQRHAEYFAGLAELGYAQIRGARHRYWFARLRSERDNLWAALGWSLGGAQPAYGLRLVAALRDYWYYRSPMEGRRWTDLALERSGDAPLALRAGALLSAGYLAYALNDLPEVSTLPRQALELYRQLGDERNIAWSLAFLAPAGAGVSSPAEIREGFALAQESLLIFRRLQDQAGIAQALNQLGELARLAGHYDEAEGYYRECLEIVKVTGEQIREAMQYDNLGYVAYHQQHYAQAEQFMRQALRLFLELETPYGVATSLSNLAGPTAALGQPERAARLLGAANAQLESIGINHQPADQGEVRLFSDSARRALGEQAFQAAWQAGQAFTFEEAIAFAFGGSTAAPQSSA